MNDPIAPGSHNVEVRFETARGVGADSSREIGMRLEARTRYGVVARYESNASPKWEPKFYPEPIGDCTSRFRMGKAGKQVIT